MSELATRDQGAVERQQPTAAQHLMSQVRGDEFKQQVEMAIPENMPPSRFVRATVTALLQNESLANVDRDSFFASILKCAQDGLLPDGREAAVVPYKGKAQYLPMIGGYRKIAGEHGWTIDTVVVHAADEFSYELGLDPKVIHRPAPINSDRGELVAAYAIGRHRDGRRMVEVYEAAKVEAAKGVAQTDRVWKQWPTQMWEKTVGKRLFAKLPLDPSDKRVAGLVVDAEVIGPDASATMLYGPHDQPVGQVREITQESTAAHSEHQVPVASEAPVESQQAAPPPVTPVPPGGGAAPGNHGPAFPIPDQVVDKWGAVPVQDGWTVAQVCADGAGQSWVRAVLAGDDATVNAGVREALTEYARARHPELLP